MGWSPYPGHCVPHHPLHLQYIANASPHLRYFHYDSRISLEVVDEIDGPDYSFDTDLTVTFGRRHAGQLAYDEVLDSNWYSLNN